MVVADDADAVDGDGCSGSWILMMATDALMDGDPHIRLTFTSRS